MSEIPESVRCLHWEICRLPKGGDNKFCILHSPEGKGGGNPYSEFQTKLIQMLEQGHTNFQKVYFQQSNLIQDLECLEVLDLTDTNFEAQGTLSFKGVTLRTGLKLTSKTLGAIVFENDCTFEDLVTISVESTKATQVIIGHKVTFHQDLTICHSSTIQNFEIRNQAVFEGNLSIQAENLQGFTANVGTALSGLDLQNVRINGGLDLSKVKFSPESEVNLNGSTINPNGGFSIGDSSVPRILHINGLSAYGAILASPSLHSPMQVLAPTKPPQFNWEHEVRIKNCDLSECCLLGNNLEKFKFTNVQWRRWHPLKNFQVKGWYPFARFSGLSRDILQDELVMRDKPSRNSVEIRYLKESYQVLKEQYQQKGNQLQAGYFHYGEMEMRRYEQGWRQRFFSLDALYWLLNGYGIGWGRAFGLLLVGTLLASGIYWKGDVNETCHNWFYEESYHSWFYWLRHSVQVGTFQRPTLDSPSELSHWTQVIQTIWSPVQIGLLGLAIRMRVRR